MTSAATFPATGPDALSGSDEAGFTLLEVIVTIAILALTFTILFQTIAETVDRTGQSENLGRAQLLARSLLDQVGRELPMKAGESVGEDGNGLHWRLRQSPYREAGDNGQSMMAAMQVSAEIFWGRPPFSHSITISTLRLDHVRTR